MVSQLAAYLLTGRPRSAWALGAEILALYNPQHLD